MADKNQQVVLASPTRRLDSWKEIGGYLGRTVRTVQRWEREQALPVHRLAHNRQASVYAFTDELDAWWDQRRQTLTEPDPKQDDSPIASSRRNDYDTESRPPSLDGVLSHPEFRFSYLVAAGAVLLAATFPLRQVGRSWADSPDPKSIRSIAVVALGTEGNGDVPVLGASLSHELVSYLSRVRSVRVIGGTSNTTALNGTRSLADSASVLGADAVLSGELARATNGVDLRLRLTAAQSGEVVWSGHFLGPVHTTATARGAALEAVTDLVTTLWPSERPPQANVRTPEAYAAYLRGRFQLVKRHPSALPAAETEFRRALQTDPQFSDASAGLAETLLLMGVFGFRETDRALPAAKDAAREAIRADPDNAEAYRVLGFATELAEHDWSQAEAYFQRSLALNPSAAETHHWYALLLDSTLRGDEAIREIQTARALDPFSIGINSDVGMVLAHQGRTSEAIEQFHKTLALDPNYVDAHAELGYAYRQARQYDRAINSFRRAAELGGNPVQAHVNSLICAAFRGQLAAARAMLEELKEPGRFNVPVSPLQMASALLAVGEYDKGLDLMLAHPESTDANLLIGAVYRPVWGDARFRELLRRVNLLDIFETRLREG